MLDIIKEGIKLTQSLALLPLKAANRLVDEKNTNAKQLVCLAEDFVSIPFAAAGKAVNEASRSINDTDTAKDCSSGGGPTLKNLWVNPDVTVFSDVETAPGQRRAILQVKGLLCGG